VRVAWNFLKAHARVASKFIKEHASTFGVVLTACGVVISLGLGIYSVRQLEDQESRARQELELLRLEFLPWVVPGRLVAVSPGSMRHVLGPGLEMPWFRQALITIELRNESQSEASDGRVVLWPVPLPPSDFPVDAFAFDDVCRARPLFAGLYPARNPYTFVGVGRFETLSGRQDHLKVAVHGFFAARDAQIDPSSVLCSLISYSDKTGQRWETTGLWPRLEIAQTPRAIVVGRPRQAG